MGRRTDPIAAVESFAAGLPRASPKETAAYTARLLANLRDIAACNGQALLAHLITIAQLEAAWRAED